MQTHRHNLRTRHSAVIFIHHLAGKGIGHLQLDRTFFLLAGREHPAPSVKLHHEQGAVGRVNRQESILDVLQSKIRHELSLDIRDRPNFPALFVVGRTQGGDTVNFAPTAGWPSGSRT